MRKNASNYVDRSHEGVLNPLLQEVGVTVSRSKRGFRRIVHVSKMNNVAGMGGKYKKTNIKSMLSQPRLTRIAFAIKFTHLIE